MVFGGGAPSFDWQRATETGEGVAQFRCSGNHCRALPADERSHAPAWWWQPAFEVLAQQEEMPPLCSIRLELPLSSTYADGAAVLIATLADETSLPWRDEFPRKDPEN